VASDASTGAARRRRAAAPRDRGASRAAGRRRGRGDAAPTPAPTSGQREEPAGASGAACGSSA
jgi:hypothetical protein